MTSVQDVTQVEINLSRSEIYNQITAKPTYNEHRQNKLRYTCTSYCDKSVKLGAQMWCFYHLQVQMLGVCIYGSLTVIPQRMRLSRNKVDNQTNCPECVFTSYNIELCTLD